MPVTHPDQFLQRLDVGLRDRDGLRAVGVPVADPLWMLARQWQMGEFQAQDMGSPIAVKVETAQTLMDEVAWQGRSPIPLDPTRQPLEPLVFEEATDTTREQPYGDRALRQGRDLMRRVRQSARSKDLQAALLQHFPLPALEGTALPAAEQRRLAVYRGKLPDSVRLALFVEELFPNDLVVLFDDMQLAPDLRAPLGEILSDWFLANPRPAHRETSAWDDAAQSYAFEVSARNLPGSDTVKLAATSHRGGPLDWYDFDITSGALGQFPPPADARTEHFAMPMPVDVPGMPSPRFWEVEPDGVEYGLLDPAPEDLGRLIVQEAALSYGNDWHLVPLPMPVGTLYRVISVTVQDTFGTRTTRSPYGAADLFSLFSPSGQKPPDGSFGMVFPALPPHLRSALRESVSFHPDEGANLAWGIEAVAPDPNTGRPHDRPSVPVTPTPDQRAAYLASTDAEKAYQLATPVPAHWVPLLPQIPEDPLNDPGRMLTVGRLLNSETGHVGQPLGQILTDPNGVSLRQEEVPTQGASVTRRGYRARWHGGTTVGWDGRRKLFGHGKDGSSGLRYDVLKPVPPLPDGARVALPDGSVSLRDAARFEPDLQGAGTRVSLRRMGGDQAGRQSVSSILTDMARTHS